MKLTAKQYNMIEWIQWYINYNDIDIDSKNKERLRDIIGDESSMKRKDIKFINSLYNEYKFGIFEYAIKEYTEFNQPDKDLKNQTIEHMFAAGVTELAVITTVIDGLYTTKEKVEYLINIHTTKQ